MSSTPDYQKQQENHEQLNQKPEQKAAFQETFTGDYKAVFKMGDYDRMVKVRPLTETDIAEIIGAITLNTEQKERAVKEALDLSNLESDEQLIEKGQEAKVQTMDTVDALKGQAKFLSELRNLVMNGLTRKGAEIFVLERAQADEIFKAKQSELRAPNLSVAPDYSDIDSLSSQYALVTSPGVGEDLKKIFVDNGHRIKEMPSGKGFQAEIGNLSLAFLYPDKLKTTDASGKEEMVETETDKENENQKDTDNVVNLNNSQTGAYQKAA